MFQIVARSEEPINESVKEKISNYCHVDPDQVICLSDQASIYRVPLVLVQQGLIDYFSKKFKLTLKLDPSTKFLHKWRRLAERHDRLLKTVSIALVGKYTKLEDSYASVVKALNHASLTINRRLQIFYIEGSSLEETTKQQNPSEYYEAWQQLCKADGLLVPGGFGDRGIEGKILAIEHARRKKQPFLGVCLGFQCAVVEFCRNELEIKDAESQEQNPDAKEKVVIEMPEHNGGNLGGTMRVGRRETIFVNKDSILYRLYNPKNNRVFERHRHRYEVNIDMVDQLEKAGMIFVGKDTTMQRMEIMELRDHPYFVGVQFHPEYTSRPLKPSVPYLGLLLASAQKLESYLAQKEVPNSNSDTDVSDSDSTDNSIVVVESK